MPWEEVTLLEKRTEFVNLANLSGSNIKELCSRFGISRKTGYKWLSRARQSAVCDETLMVALTDRSRRPKKSPGQTCAKMEELILELRSEHEWGGRKLAARLKEMGHRAADIPSPSTITAILQRHGLVDSNESAKRVAWHRFEHAAPNILWQMDFKGDFPLIGINQGQRCYPLTLLDDHSRYALGLEACANQQRATVQQQLTLCFKRYGLPLRMTMDNGSPWGASGREGPVRHTRFSAWLMQLGIKVSYSRPFHPQTQGKLERYHRSLKAEVLYRYPHEWHDLLRCQQRFDQWRHIYNTVRPHESLDMQTPLSRYRSSERSFPETLPEVESYYAPGDVLRKVADKGEISFRGCQFLAGRAFTGQRVALRPTEEEAKWEIFYCAGRVGELDLREGKRRS